MPKSQLKRTMEGAFILTIASFIAKVLSRFTASLSKT